MQVQLKVANGNKAGQLITINRPRFLIGRAEDCHLKPKSELISRYHCAILSEDGYVAARDLGSKNGIFLNGKKIAVEEELKNGDHLVIGPLDFEVVLSVALAAEKKPKVESIQDVVARTVERDTMVPAGATKVMGNEPVSNDDSAADWLLAEDEDEETPAKGGSTRTIQGEQLAELGLAPDVKKEADELLNMNNKQAKAGETTKTVTTSSAPPENPDAAANLLKSFFQGH